MSHYEELRRKQVHQMLASIPDFVGRLAWPRAQIEVQRRRALRLLLRVAKEYSPWYRERLRDIDPGSVTEADLAQVPPTTRDELMDHWDDIVIYPSLKLESVEAHLRDRDRDGFLLDSFHAVSSSGACGRRGVFVYDWDGWIASFAGSARWRLRNRGRALDGVQPVVVLIGAGGPSHIHSSIHESFSLGRYHRVPDGCSTQEALELLERLRPDVLVGYPSVLRELAHEVEHGQVEMRPRYVTSIGEPLAAETRALFEQVWDAHVVDAWGISEALPLGQSCGSGGGLHVSDDLVLLEPIDASGARAEPGQPSASALVTNLYNLALPIIRCEIDDRVTVSPDPCRCGSAYTLVTEVQRRRRERFVYDDGVSLDPAEIGSLLAREKAVQAYQVRQTHDGAEIHLKSQRPLHLRAVAQRVASALGKGGLDSPSVSVHRVDEIERDPAGGLRRYVPRPASLQPLSPPVTS